MPEYITWKILCCGMAVKEPVKHWTHSVILIKILDLTGIRAKDLSTLIKFTKSFDE
jgi:hypothetical protein